MHAQCFLEGTTKHISKCCQMIPRGQNLHLLRTTWFEEMLELQKDVLQETKLKTLFMYENGHPHSSTCLCFLRPLSLSKQLKRKGSSQRTVEGLRCWEVRVAELKAAGPATVRIGKQWWKAAAAQLRSLCTHSGSHPGKGRWLFSSQLIRLRRSPQARQRPSS